MRTHLKVSAVLVTTLLASTAGVVAQTGEFASPVTGSTMHQAYDLQDYWQMVRTRGLNPEGPALAGPPVEIAPPPAPQQAASNVVKSKKVTKNTSVQPKQPQ
jgi:hypothetical protein